MFKKLIDSIDKRLEKTFDPPIWHCDGCGEPLPHYYLKHDDRFAGDFCKRCEVNEEE